MTTQQRSLLELLWREVQIEKRKLEYGLKQRPHSEELKLQSDDLADFTALLMQCGSLDNPIEFPYRDDLLTQLMAVRRKRQVMFGWLF